jgi:predicted AAA+ superfamily ATPase
MESFVFQELLKLGFEPNKNIYYFGNGFEVDFVLKEELKVKQLIQVTYASAKDEVEKREIRALIKASEVLRCKDSLVITWDFEDEMKMGNRRIKFLPLWRWLIK